jgi:hypothetical protein
MEKIIKNNKLILDNVISNAESEKIKSQIFGVFFNWYYKDYVVADEDATENTQDYQFQFTHQFQENGNIVTPMENWEMLFPIFYVIQPMNFIRVKANLIPRAEKIVSHGLHIDTFTPYSITGIYYVNNNNGCTEFEDGDKVESKQNRIVLFPSNMQHTGTTCTDAKVRVAININFIPYVNEDSMYKEIFNATQWQAITKWCTK